MRKEYLTNYNEATWHTNKLNAKSREFMIFHGIKNAEKTEKERNVYKILHRDGREG